MDEDDRPSMARGIAAGGWLLFGFCFTASLAIASLQVRTLSLVCAGLSLGTTLFPLVAMALGVKEVVSGGRRGTVMAFVVGALHLLTVAFLIGVFALIVMTSGPHR